MTGYYLVKNGNAQEAFEERKLQLADPGEGQVQIEVEAFGLNYADVMARMGLYRDAPPKPCILGYEVVGKVVKCGANVAQDQMGKRVLAFTLFGGYATHVNTRSDAAVSIGEMPAEIATALATQYVTAEYMFYFKSVVQPNDRILIHAASGGVGTALVQMGLQEHCHITGMAGTDEKCERLRNAGVQETINYRKLDYFKLLKEQDKKFDFIFNPVGGKTFKNDMKLLAQGGQLFLFGGSERTNGSSGLISTLSFVFKMGIIIPIGLMMGSKTVSGINMLHIAQSKPLLMEKLLKQVVDKAQKGNYTPVVDSVFPIDQLAEAHEKLAQRKTKGKVTVRL